MPSHSMLFCYNSRKMLQELNPYFYQLAYGKTVSFFVTSLKAVGPIDNTEDLLYFCNWIKRKTTVIF